MWLQDRSTGSGCMWRTGLELKHWQGIEQLWSRTRVRGLAAKVVDYTYLDNCDAPEQNVGHNEVEGMSLVPADEASKECAAECTRALIEKETTPISEVENVDILQDVDGSVLRVIADVQFSHKKYWKCFQE